MSVIKFSADQWYGSLLFTGLLYTNAQGLKAALNRQGVVEGKDSSEYSSIKKERNYHAIVTSSARLGMMSWALLSSRGAIPPQGNSYKERIIDVIKHPERSHEQLRYLFFMLNFVVGQLGYIKYGFTKKNKMPEEVFSKRYQAIVTPIVVMLGFLDLFEDKNKRKPKETASVASENEHQLQMSFSASQSKTLKNRVFYPLRVIRDSWRHNPRRVMSILLGFSLSFVSLQEGLVKERAMRRRLNNATHAGSKSWL